VRDLARGRRIAAEAHEMIEHALVRLGAVVDSLDGRQ